MLDELNVLNQNLYVSFMEIWAIRLTFRANKLTNRAGIKINVKRYLIFSSF